MEQKKRTCKVQKIFAELEMSFQLMYKENVTALPTTAVR